MRSKTFLNHWSITHTASGSIMSTEAGTGERLEEFCPHMCPAREAGKAVGCSCIATSSCQAIKSWDVVCGSETDKQSNDKINVAKR